MPARRQLGLFLAAYVFYDLARWITVGHVTPATEHARWVLWLLWGPIVSLAVVATGNHGVFDIAAGLLVAGAGHLVGRLPRRLPTLLPAPRLALSGETT
jgi:hypothetical protein